MGLHDAEARQRDEKVGTSTPYFDCFGRNSHLRNATVERCELCSMHACVAYTDTSCPNNSVDQVERYRYVDVHPGVQRCARQMIHNRHDEANERDDVLDNKELVTPVPNRSKCAQVDPKQDRKGCDAGDRTIIGCPLQLHESIYRPCATLEAKVENGEQEYDPSCPTMEDIEAFVRHASHQSDQVVLADQKNE